MLEGVIRTNSLWSSYEGDNELRANGFEPSKRAAMFLPGERKVEIGFVHENCPTCSGWDT